MQDPAEQFANVAAEIARRAKAAGMTIAAAESLTSGALSNALGAGNDASDWFRGGVVAYAEGVKRELLGVTAESVTSAQCARELATGVARVLGADAAVAVTGVGGPESADGQPPGTVFAAVTVRGTTNDTRLEFHGDPSEVVHQTVRAALELLRDALPPSA
ncbi:CinA family protein [Agromyces sp. ISL-38]|uniref:CinA family protein n=1 Tax=Agromyces sp. ISL-38 TaxID=2819107 RepID=UPI001BE8B6FC|nr:CinA family protein [Agromyces sp. ISL-38]MBT2497478.1 CinA family protein [Agromyces sp. ISL-38]MBT2517972.1 CinA family protein [Streptomyces sp. ISL-90]